MIYIVLSWIAAPWLYLRLLWQDKPSEPQEILLIQTAKIGDFICATPLFREIKRRYPHSRLSVLIHPVNTPLAAYNPHIDLILSYQDADYRGLSGKWRLLKLLRRHGFDTVIGISPNIAFILAPLWAGAARRLSILPNFAGRSYRLAAPFLTSGEPHVAGRLVLDTAFALLRRLDIQPASRDKEIQAHPAAGAKFDAWLEPLAENRRLVGIGLSSGNKLKELGTPKLTRLIRQFIAQTEDLIVLIGTAQDRAQGEEILRSSAASGRVVNSAGVFSLEELPALISRLGLYVGVDSGITYMADALHVPLIDIMGPADAGDQRPAGKNALVLRPGIACAPCSHAFHAPYFCAAGTRACISEVDHLEIVKLALNSLNQHKHIEHAR